MIPSRPLAYKVYCLLQLVVHRPQSCTMLVFQTAHLNVKICHVTRHSCQRYTRCCCLIAGKVQHALIYIQRPCFDLSLCQLHCMVCWATPAEGPAANGGPTAELRGQHRMTSYFVTLGWWCNAHPVAATTAEFLAGLLWSSLN